MIGENEKEVHSIKNFVSSLKIMVLKIMIMVMVTMITMITMIIMITMIMMITMITMMIMMMTPNHLPEGEDLKVGGIACPETFTLLSPEEPIW